jgi:hypothetical protein
MDLANCKDRLSLAGVKFDEGLSSKELELIEGRFQFHFPPDLREFLGCALPISKGWIDWRRWSDSEIQARLNWPFEGICFDIQHNAFWLDRWGEKPAELTKAFERARATVEHGPRLIPIYGHRYMPDCPCTPQDDCKVKSAELWRGGLRSG